MTLIIQPIMCKLICLWFLPAQEPENHPVINVRFNPETVNSILIVSRSARGLV
jgi:hypothetical protein